MISCKLFSICGGLYTWPVHVACTRDGSSFHKLQVKEEHVDNRPGELMLTCNRLLLGSQQF